MIRLFLFFIIIFVPYLLLTLWLWRGWVKLPRFETGKPELSPEITVSVIIPMRNESLHIGQLLGDIAGQHYPQELIRVYVIDDHSTDHSPTVVKDFARKHPNIALLHLPDEKQGKKAALHHTLPQLTTDLAVTTDADCRVSENWLATIAGYYAIHRPAMIICPVMLTRGTSFFSRWQSLELMSLTGSSAGAASWKYAVMCSGANLVMERNVMERYSYIYESRVVSGDDMMMMIKIKKNFPERIACLKSVSATVETLPQPDLKSFIRQRNRWTSKSSGYTDKEVIAVALIVFAANLSIIACLFAGFLSARFFILAGALWFAKTLVDWPFLASLARFWSRKCLMRIFFPAQILYPFYIVWTGIAGNIVSISWKGRKSKI